MYTLVIGIVVLIGSALTLFSGFGLGTLLMPVMSIFFPLELAIFLTAIVHFFNNLFKLFFFYRHIDWKIILRFAPTAIIGAWLGSLLLSQIEDWNHPLHLPLTQTTTNTINITIGCLLLVFALLEWTPARLRPAFNQKWLPFGGAISGFFGGLSGHQGALRSAFLAKTNLSKDGLIGTGIIIATCIDVSRMANYVTHLNTQSLWQNSALLTFTIVCSCTGVILGKKLLGSMTLPFLQKIIAISLILFSLCLIIGWI